MTVASHYDNNDSRRDITLSQTDFLKNTIAISAGTNQDGSGKWTSHGFGVEFFESYTRVEMDARYPVKNFDANGTMKTIAEIFNSTPQESATCSIIAAKFALIQDFTDANWQLVREAARMTASNSTVTTVNGKKVYTPNWDMKRGFGIIDVQKAVEYIQDNYSNNEEYKDSCIPALPRINPLLKLKDLDDDNPISKKMLLDYMEEIIKEIGIKN